MILRSSRKVSRCFMIIAFLLLGFNLSVSQSEAAPDPNNWYLKSHYGLFNHFTYGSSTFTQTIYPNGTVPLDINELGNNFNATQYAADAHSFGVDYVAFTVWHYAMNTLYPSTKMNQWRPGHSSNHDVIQDLINALQPYGIKLVLYIHVTDGHDFTAADQTATGWNNSAGGYLTWNNFVNDIVTELGNRYGTAIDGYFVDMMYESYYQNMIDKARLRTSMLAGNPNRIIIGSGGTGDAAVSLSGGAADYMAREYYNQPTSVNTWPATNNMTATVMTTQNVSPKWAWWASVPQGTNVLRNSPEEMFRFTVLEAGVNRNGGGMLWDAGTYAGSGALWEDGIKSALTTLGTYVNAVGTSLKNVFPSTSYPRASGVTLNGLANGIVATKSTDDTVEYIHVLNPPSGTKVLTLPVPADGKLFSSATILKNGHSVSLSQNSSGVTLTLGSSDSWDSLDTVIKLVVSGYDGFSYLNDTASSITYNGSWGLSSNRNVGDYLNDVHYTTTNNNYFQYTFTGTGIEYISSKDSNYGNIDIYIDNVFKQTVSAVNATGYLPQQVLYGIYGLTSGSHTIKGVKTSGSYMQLDKFKIITTATPNLAINKTVTASSTVDNTDWGVAKATDGTTSSIGGSMGWSSANSLTTNHTEWVTVDLGTSQSFSKVVLYPRNDGVNTGYGFPINFTIDVSTNNSTWNTVITNTGYALPSGTGQTFTFAAQNARYIRVNGTSLRQNPNDSNQYRMQFAEIVVNP
ncbi:discoidin domain-containing protein [Cohnella endophytica]|uniref:Discoidin domain-containing protein n=1 Tax=Cohnella endophytica TaxID=2419778 RepID=A0A494Y0K3_9BACL|nr:discoidin domain-containing protein [Cohnella endophytica]RKP56286.1 discoidin domain-containing protein [Cohnella endophytica]